MTKESVFTASCILTLALAGNAAAAGEVGEVQIRQAETTLDEHQVAGDINLFAAYFQPKDYAFDDRVQFNVNILYNMNGAPYADGVAVAYPNGMDVAEVGPGIDWVSPNVWYTPRIETPIELSFDRAYGINYVILLDRGTPKLSVHVAGDVNGDGFLNINDAMLVAQASAGQVTLSQMQKGVADVNCDNAVNIVDALLIGQVSAGNPTAQLGCN